MYERGIRLRGHNRRYSSTTPVVTLQFQKRTQNAHRHVLHAKTSRLRLLATTHLSQN